MHFRKVVTYNLLILIEIYFIYSQLNFKKLLLKFKSQPDKGHWIHRALWFFEEKGSRCSDLRWFPRIAGHCDWGLVLWSCFRQQRDAGIQLKSSETAYEKSRMQSLSDDWFSRRKRVRWDGEWVDWGVQGEWSELNVRLGYTDCI